MNSLSAFLIVCVMTSLVLALPFNKQSSIKKCSESNCTLPDCRCWNDPLRPGNFSNSNTPQIIVLSFDYAFNEDTAGKYEQLFEGLMNPNGCPATGTFFVQALNSEAATIAKLYKSKHEIAINSANGIIPTTVAGWRKSFNAVKKLISDAGVPTNEVKGVRAPGLFTGGNQQFEVQQEMGLSYDSSCVNTDFSKPRTLLWPYTLDFVNDLYSCDIGKTVNESFAGIWSFPMPVLSIDGQQCPTPSGCLAAINTTDKVFDLFMNAFDAHYYYGKAPFILDIDPLWVTENYRIMGTKEFLEIVAAYPDTWIITMSQALAWIQNPEEMTPVSSFTPWGCSA